MIETIAWGILYTFVSVVAWILGLFVLSFTLFVIVRAACRGYYLARHEYERTKNEPEEA